MKGDSHDLMTIMIQGEIFSILSVASNQGAIIKSDPSPENWTQS